MTYRWTLVCCFLISTYVNATGIQNLSFSHRCLGLISTIDRERQLSGVEKHAQDQMEWLLKRNAAERGEILNEDHLPNLRVSIDSEFYHSQEYLKTQSQLSAEQALSLDMQVEMAAEFLAAYDRATFGNPRTLFPIKGIEFRSHRYLNRGSNRSWFARDYDYLPESGILLIGLREDPKSGGFRIRSSGDIREAFAQGKMFREEHIPFGGLKKKKFGIIWRMINPMSPIRIKLREKLDPLLKDLIQKINDRDDLVNPHLESLASARQISFDEAAARLVDAISSERGREEALSMVMALGASDLRAQIQNRPNSNVVIQVGLINVSSIDNVTVLDGVIDSLDLSPASISAIENAHASVVPQNRNFVLQIFPGINVSTLDNIKVYADLIHGISKKINRNDILRLLVSASSQS